VTDRFIAVASLRDGIPGALEHDAQDFPQAFLIIND
jgi:hypothetical protein